VRRRRKPRVVWIPQSAVGQLDFGGGAGAQLSTWHSTSIVMGNNVGDAAGIEVPLVNDGSISNPEDGTSGAAFTLSDIENSGYRLRRIVGNLYCALAPQNDDIDGVIQASGRNVFAVTAGIIVRRENMQTGGSTNATVGFDEVRPDCVKNQLDPWVWRRTWVLQDPPQQHRGGSDPTDVFITRPFSTRDFPSANWGWQYPGPTQGPNVDQKTARVIAQEERLYLDVSVTTLLNPDTNDTHALALFWDFRVLGSMRNMAGNRRNASR